MSYQSASYQAEAEQYDGSNLQEIRDILSRQSPPGRVTVTGLYSPYIRTMNRPDHPLIPGDWILLDAENWACHLPDEFFTRLFWQVAP